MLLAMTLYVALIMQGYIIGNYKNHLFNAKSQSREKRRKGKTKKINFLYILFESFASLR